MAVEDPPAEDVSDWKATVQDVEEDLSQLGGHGGVEGRIEPQDFASPPPSRLPLLDSWLVGELLSVACPLNRLLVRHLCVVEDFLIGGEE